MFTFEIIIRPHTLMRGNLPSTTQTQLLQNQHFLTSSLTITISYFYWENRTTEQGEGSNPQHAHPIDIETHTIYHLYNVKVSSTPRHSIPHRHAPLEDFFPCISQNNFYIHSHCSSFAISSMVEVGGGYSGVGLGGGVGE